MAPVPVSSEAIVLSAPPPAPPVEAVSVGETPGPGEEIRPDAFPAAPVGDAGSLIRKALEERRKMLLASTLGEADCIEADGNYLCISFPKEKAYFKSQIETRDNRRLIEEVCRELFGRSLTLSVSVGGKVKPAGQPEDRPQPVRMPKPKADSHPMVKALVDKFHGEVVDVVEPDM